jgi:hypothetical protein
LHGDLEKPQIKGFVTLQQHQRFFRCDSQMMEVFFGGHALRRAKYPGEGKKKFLMKIKKD